MPALLHLLLLLLHPFYVSVVDLNHNADDKTLEVSVRIFTEDFEETLRMQYPAEKIDLIRVVNPAKTDSLISRYVRQKLALSAGNQLLNLRYLGFEKIEESIWCYFEVANVPVIKQLHVSNRLLYEFKKEQINMHNVTVGGQRKSYKLSNPDSQFDLNF
jgi:hypothetical protein